MESAQITVNLDQYNQYHGMDWLTAKEATERLGVRPQTLYAYASRGRVQVRADPDDPRRSLYRAADLAALQDRKRLGRRAAEVMASATSFGEPILESEITTVAGGRLYYRGRDAVSLAEVQTLEGVARLLRGGHGVALKRSERPPPPGGREMRERAFAVLAERAGRDPPARGRAPLTLAAEAATLLDLLTDAVAGEIGGGPIHARLADAWGRRGDARAADLIRRALVLLADHEFNASTFACRVAASTGASLAASALAGLCALSGPLHGGAAARVAELVQEAQRVGAQAAVTVRLARGDGFAGFGHPLYPDHDPRAEALLSHFAPPEPIAALRDAVESRTGQRANIDFALVALARALTLPPDAPFALFAVARCAGWIAHAIEQGQSGRLIRPRARYVGELPDLD